MPIEGLDAGAADWIAELPALVADLERAWSIRVGRLLGDGTEAVLKLRVPAAGDAIDAPGNEIEVLRLARAPGCGLPTGAPKGRWLADSITSLWQELDRPCPERSVDHALSCAARRIAAHDDERTVLVHGDVHQWNALEAGDGFKLVDPDGLLAEAEYDLGILMREDPVELMTGDPRARSRWLARRSGLDAAAIWEWGVVERVSTGLLATRLDLQPAGREMLAAAERASAD